MFGSSALLDGDIKAVRYEKYLNLLHGLSAEKYTYLK